MEQEWNYRFAPGANELAIALSYFRSPLNSCFSNRWVATSKSWLFANVAMGQLNASSSARLCAATSSRTQRTRRRPLSQRAGCVSTRLESTGVAKALLTDNLGEMARSYQAPRDSETCS